MKTEKQIKTQAKEILKFAEENPEAWIKITKEIYAEKEASD